MNSKQKGKRGELELVKELKKYGFNCRRTVQYNGKAEEGEADLIGLEGIHIECKRVEKLNVYSALKQAINDCKNGNLPAVFWRKNKEDWVVILQLDDFMKLYKKGDVRVEQNTKTQGDM